VVAKYAALGSSGTPRAGQRRVAGVSCIGGARLGHAVVHLRFGRERSQIIGGQADGEGATLDFVSLMCS
jgi:hypothetical protein